MWFFLKAVIAERSYCWLYLGFFLQSKGFGWYWDSVFKKTEPRDLFTLVNEKSYLNSDFSHAVVLDGGKGESF